METLNWIDKSAWADGEWQQEPDRIEWVYLGFPCLIVRQHEGTFSGYVAINKTHPYYGKDMDDNELKFIRVHGKITFSGGTDQNEDPRAVCHKLLPKTANDWWIGFDCMHSENVIPIMVNFFNLRDSTYKNIEYVKNQVENLAEQLNNLKTE
ncbi:hypothetical protein [Nostoc sp. C117]|uniref:hypothetical protein n=1 Tax=Nostoc sp. C117 TaxID=3349875 RepID=UPI00370DCD91